MRLFAYALLGALVLCDSARCGEQESATDRYARAVHDAEQRHGPMDAALVPPLAHLGDALAAAGQPAAAIDALTRAVSILRRSRGLYDPAQSLLLSQLADLHSLQGDIDATLEVLAYMETVSERAVDPQSEPSAGSLAEIGSWHCRLGRFDSGRERLRRSIERLRKVANQTLIYALLELAHCSLYELAAEGIATAPATDYRGPVLRRNRMSIGSPAFRYRVHKIMRPEGDQALRDAAHLVENTTLLSAMRRAAVLVQVGDWFQAKDHSRTARQYYASAQQLAKGTVMADDPLAAPVQILYPVPALALRGGPAREPSSPERYVEIEFTVRADGRIDRERVLTREPGKSAADETLQALQAARYRPRMVDGTALDTEGVRFRQAFK